MEINVDARRANADTPVEGQPFVPPSQQPFSFRNRWKSVGYTIKGAQYVFRTQHSTWVQVPIVLTAVAAGFYLGISRIEWLAIVMCSGLLLVTEAMNTAVETVVDLVSPEYNKLAGTAKDVAAGAVLLAAVTGLVVMAIVFTPYILARLG